MNTKRSREYKCKSLLQSKNNEPMITVVIPTNRFDCVNYLLHKSIYLYRGKLFSFEVHDSSIDDRIQKEVKNFISQNPRFPIRYFRYCQSISADQKAIKAIEAVKTQYFWLYGDGNLTDFNMIDSILHRNKFWDYNVIDLEILARKTHLNHDGKFNSDTIYEITSPNEYIIKYFSHLTYWGAALVNTNFFQHAYNNGLVNKYADASIPWWIACIIFDLIAHDFECGIADKMGVLYSDSLRLNPVKTDHWWTHDDRYYDYTFVLFNKGIEMMSGLYPNYIKRKVIINFRKDALVSLSYLVYLRSIRNLNFTKISKYKADIYRIPYFYYLMCIYCLIPIFLAKLIICLKPFIKRVFFEDKEDLFMKVVLLAGGFGTRISEESQFKPKPMIEIGGLPILWHIMKCYSYYGFNEFIICAGYKQHYIKEWFADYFLHTSDLTFDFTQGNKIIVHNQHSEPWKVTVVDTGLNTMTGGRIKRIQPYVGNHPFMMTYGDGLCDVNIADLVEYHKSHGKIATLTAVQLEQSKGVLNIGADNAVRSFREKAARDSAPINAGFMVLQPEVFNYLDGDGCIFERTPLERLAKEGQLMSYKYKGFWQCMDTKREKDILEELWDSGKAPWKVWDK